MRAMITVGMGFGDEGKGATVDYLTRVNNAKWVVRYSGGAQAGHNVQLPVPHANGSSFSQSELRHTFSQFGSGTLAGAGTYIGPRVILCPASLQPEAEHLRRMGIESPLARYLVHPDCLLSTIYHIAVNRLRELARGNGRHGSCGLGMGESRRYWVEHANDAVVAADLKDTTQLTDKLTTLQRRLQRQIEPIVSQSIKLDDSSQRDQWQEALACLYDTTPREEVDEIQSTAGDLQLSAQLPDCECAIFEGAQGVLLDEWLGFHPYTTWSTVTAQHALELLEEAPGPHQVTTWGVTRAYSTRHGAGPFPTEARQIDRFAGADDGNPVNAWQGGFRAGPLDFVLLRYAAKACPVDGIVVNGLDQLPDQPRICDSYEMSQSLESVESGAASLRDLRLPTSLAQQAELTDLLTRIQPRYSDCTAELLLEKVNEIAPVVLHGVGPTFLDRKQV